MRQHYLPMMRVSSPMLACRCNVPQTGIPMILSADAVLRMDRDYMLCMSYERQN